MSENNTIPNHWQVKKLGEVCHTTSGGTPNRSNPKYYQGNIPWVKSGELDKGLILDTEEKISEEAIKNSSAKIFPKGTLLIALYGATIGKLAFLGIDAATNQAVCGIFKNENIDSNYLFNFLSYKRPSLVKQGIGGAQPNISQGILKNLDVPLPPLPEQHAIVSKIEELFSELDNGKQQLQTALQQLKVYRQSLLKAAFEGKLKGTEKWFSSTLGEICDMKAGFFVKASEIQNEYKDGLFPCYGGNGLRGYTKSHTHEGKFSLVGRQGALCGNVHLVSGKFHATEHAVVTTAKSNIDIVWLFHKLTSMRLNQYSQGAAQPGLSVNKLLPIKVEVPPIKDQLKIVLELESKLTVCDKIEETITQSLQQAETLRQSILKQAFEGKLVEIAPKGRDTKTMGAAHREEDTKTAKAPKGRYNPEIKK
ncbi:MAG: restriction endonuclease subunit S [Bacteroidetes bacterium]|nr:restriction endonuclease subunit S [Bacteroidota bacterium]